MKAMRKAAGLLLVILACACGGGGAQQQEIVADAVNIWAIDSLASKDPQAAYIQALVDNFKKQNPDIKINWISAGTSLTAVSDKTREAMEKMAAPDIMQTGGGYLINLFAEAEKIIDVSAEFSGADLHKLAKEVMVWNDKTYGVAPFFSVAGLFINEGKFKELGIAVPKTVDDLEAAAEKLKAAGLQPFAADAADKRAISFIYMYLVNRFDPEAFMQALNRRKRFDIEPFNFAAEKIKQWAQKGYFGALPLKGEAGGAQKLMTAGKAGMHVSGTWQCRVYGDAKKTSETIGFYPFPTVLGRKGDIKEILGMTEVGFVATTQAEAKKDQVVKFMRSFLDPEIAKTDTSRICAINGVKPSGRLLEMASAEFNGAKTLQFYWDQIMYATLLPGFDELIASLLLADTDVQKATKVFEQKVQTNMGGVMDF